MRDLKMANKHKRVEAKCLFCKGSFHPRERDVLRGNGRFCGRRCSNSARKVNRTPLAAHSHPAAQEGGL